MINLLIKKAKELNISLEVFAKTENSHEISVLNHTLEKFESSSITNYKIKALCNGKNVVIETDHICVDDIIRVIQEASEITDNDDKDLLASGSICSEVDEDCDLDYRQITDDLLSLDDLKGKYSELNSMSLFFGHYYEIMDIVNEKASFKDANYYNYFYGEIVVKDQEEVRTAYFNFVFKEYDFDEIKRKLVHRIEETIRSIHCVSARTGRYSIILKNRCVYKILNTFADMFSAELIQKKQSVLTNQFEQQIFSPKITIVEDPINDCLVGKRLFDDEGVKTTYKEMVKDGKFISKLYHNQSALKENGKSTGNSYGVRNMYIVPGNKSEYELLKILDEGIVITEIEGLHAGVNKLTGKISLQANGYYVKDSKWVKALNMIVLATDLFELFGNVKEIGNDLEFFSKIGGAPSLLIENITIVGKE
ncbi:MAG: metallopeptidase TldD-related protein [bacterium]|nr:metallopeptidase TldD-related protein [bacterium]